MFYLTYRPKTIAELDTKLVRDRITALLSQPTLPHALLLTGQKGMGKTSTARILAKAVNCEHNAFGDGQGIEPCNTCATCTSITAGQCPDVMELDAASNRGIEDIKNMVREAQLLPMMGRYRVYIIDECHMITTEGFNALLKTLEEPPEHVIFILATTNPEKLPKTIQSRCVTLHFGKATEADIILMLERVLKGEKKHVFPEVLGAIARFSDASFRDASTLLEEVLVHQITSEHEVLNLVKTRNPHELLELVAGGTLVKTLAWIQDFHEGGGSMRQLVADTLQGLHSELLVVSGATTGKAHTKLSVRELALFSKLLHEAFVAMKQSPIEVLPVEIAIVEYYNAVKGN